VILYVNGDSHTAGAEAVNPHAFAEDDPFLNYLGRLPHPANLAVSWGKKMADIAKFGFQCDAESAASNQRIIRTTRHWLSQRPRAAENTLVIIQWSTWERQEWLIDGVYYQVNASGADHVPDSHQQAYKEYIAGISWYDVCVSAHKMVWDFHQELAQQGIQHVFFNGNNALEEIPQDQRLDWGSSYIEPYNAKMTYSQWLLDNGFETVAPDSWHFGKEAHSAWARFVLQYIVKHKLI
jgi:hypothetical protein